MEEVRFPCLLLWVELILKGGIQEERTIQPLALLE